jgi:hypothetical protein
MTGQIEVTTKRIPVANRVPAAAAKSLLNRSIMPSGTGNTSSHRIAPLTVNAGVAANGRRTSTISSEIGGIFATGFAIKSWPASVVARQSRESSTCGECGSTSRPLPAIRFGYAAGAGIRRMARRFTNGRHGSPSRPNKRSEGAITAAQRRQGSSRDVGAGNNKICFLEINALPGNRRARQTGRRATLVLDAVM